MRFDLGWIVKQQINDAIRKERLRAGAGTILAEDSSTHEPTVSIPVADLTRHKTSSDHDGRYFTETELGAVADGAAGADLIGATPNAVTGAANSVQEILDALAVLMGASASVYRQSFAATDVIEATHNLGAWPVIQVVGQEATAYGAGLYGAGTYGGIDNTANAVITPDSITHDTINQATITLAAAANGEVVCIG